jgi:hypothetical protein
MNVPYSWGDVVRASAFLQKISKDTGKGRGDPWLRAGGVSFTAGGRLSAGNTGPRKKPGKIPPFEFGSGKNWAP